MTASLRDALRQRSQRIRCVFARHRIAAPAAAAFVTLGLGTVGLHCVKHFPVSEMLSRPPKAPDPASDPNEALAWGPGPMPCAAGLESIGGDACFADATTGAMSSESRTKPSAAPASPRALLVYLHGRYAPQGQAEELERQARVAKLATARGYAFVAFRGMRGECTNPQLASWWCWPSNERNAGDGPRFIAHWRSALAEAERRARPNRRVLLGYSNGGYFAALIASRNLLPFDAVAIAHAGPVHPMTPVASKPPMLLVDADDDPSGPEMSSLASTLGRENWPHAVVVREGGHALPDWDIKMSLTFFDRVRTERVPLRPPLSARTTRNSPASRMVINPPAGETAAPIPIEEIP